MRFFYYREPYATKRIKDGRRTIRVKFTEVCRLLKVEWSDLRG